MLRRISSTLGIKPRPLRGIFSWANLPVSWLRGRTWRAFTVFTPVDSGTSCVCAQVSAGSLPGANQSKGVQARAIRQARRPFSQPPPPSRRLRESPRIYSSKAQYPLSHTRLCSRPHLSAFLEPSCRINLLHEHRVHVCIIVTWRACGLRQTD